MNFSDVLRVLVAHMPEIANHRNLEAAAHHLVDLCEDNDGGGHRVRVVAPNAPRDAAALIAELKEHERAEAGRDANAPFDAEKEGL